jgi:putative endonuclease
VTASWSRSTTPRADERGVAAGARAEAFAAAYLETRGLVVLERNFRTRRGEIDLVARDGATLVFVEVRKRRSAAFGGAAASITRDKRGRLIAAAEAYLARFGEAPACRFDAVLIDGASPPRVQWLRDVFGAE